MKVIGHHRVNCPVCDADRGYCHDCGICTSCETTEEELETFLSGGEADNEEVSGDIKCQEKSENTST